MFSSAISDKLFVNQSPKVLNFGGFQHLFRRGSNFSAAFLLIPSQTLHVFFHNSVSIPMYSQILSELQNVFLTVIFQNKRGVKLIDIEFAV